MSLGVIPNKFCRKQSGPCGSACFISRFESELPIQCKIPSSIIVSQYSCVVLAPIVYGTNPFPSRGIIGFRDEMMSMPIFKMHVVTP